MDINFNFWTMLGLGGQLFFFSRFLYQWIVSERRKESVIPTGFWFFSLGGSLLLLMYAIHIKDPVFILGQSTGFAIYLRNLMFIYRKKSSSTD